MYFSRINRSTIAAALMMGAGACITTTLSAQVTPADGNLSDIRKSFLEANPEVGFFELNGEIIPREKWDETPVTDGSVMEVVRMIGGG